MSSKLKQLIPGNPGTSFVVALLYTLNKKFSIPINNNDQLPIFTEGITKSRKVFFSGILNQIASKYQYKISFITNSKSLQKLAKEEIDKKLVKTVYNPLSENEIKKLIKKYEFVTLSVDLYFFKNYHDYHFVTISKGKNSYLIFEPKSGEIKNLKEKEFSELIASVDKGLKDVMAVFCIHT